MPIGTEDSAHERATLINELVISIRGTKKKVKIVAAQCEINTDVMVSFGSLLLNLPGRLEHDGYQP